MNLKEAIETAFAYHRAGDLETAQSVYDQILGQIDKPDSNVFFGYGTLLVSQEKYGLGIALLQAAIAQTPDYAPIWTNLACAYKHLGKDELSLNAYNKALELEPQQADILAGMGGFWINKGQSQKVIDYALRALEIDPNHHAAHMHLGLGLLEQGKYEEAWPHYEHRWETIERVKDKRPYKAPLWDGKPVKALAIHGEQGLGDEILFMSLLSKVRPLAETIVIECAERLIPTFADSFNLQCYKDHASLIAAHGEPDAYVPMATLPKLVGLPDGKPFLKRHKTLASKKPVIGIAWKGGTVRTNYKDRTLVLRDLKPILDIPGINFCSVQYGSGLDSELRPLGLEDLPTDFDSLHSRIANCDLVISVCQTAIHQAGAMGIECWVMTPVKAPWVCCGENMRPWYNSSKIFRQKQAGDWNSVIQEIANSLRERYAAIAA